MVYVAAAAAAALNLDAEIIDLRSLVPLDVDTICSSVQKTGRCVVAHEATRFSGFGAEIAVHRPGGMLLESGGADPAGRRAGTRLTRMLSNGSIFPARRESRSALKTVMESA